MDIRPWPGHKWGMISGEAAMLSGRVTSTRQIQNPHSGIKGVYWDIAKCAWRLHFWYTPIRGSKKSKSIFGGYFHPTENTHDAREEALILAKQALVQLLNKYNITYIQRKD